MSRRPLDVLTARESKVLDLIRRGLTNEEIAQRLGISLDGAKYHVSQILSKLGVATREEAAAWLPEKRRAWWAHWPLWAKFAGAATVAAVTAGLAILAWGVVRTEGDEPTRPVNRSPSLATPLPPTSTFARTPDPTPSDTPQPTQSHTPQPSSDAPEPTPSDTPPMTPSPTVISDLPRGDLAFDRFQAGDYSGIWTSRGSFQGAEVFQMDTADQWAAFWAAHTSTISPTPTLPPFDFTDHMLIAVATSEPSGGYFVRIDRIIESTSDLQVFSTLHEPGPYCPVTAAFTQPYEIVSVQRSSRAAALTLLTEQGPACALY